MRRVCYACGIVFGLKEPLDDDRETHGLCPECLKLELKQIQEYQDNGIDPWKKKDATS